MNSFREPLHCETHERIGVFDRRSELIDIIIVAIPFTAILFNRWLGPLTPLLVLAVTPAYVLMRWERLYPTLIKCWPLVLLPAFAMISILWSETPARTLRYGFLYLMTVLPAIFIGAGCSRDALLKGLFISFAIYMCLSLPFGRWVGWGGPGGRAFAGLLGSKNASGDAAALTIICSFAMIFFAMNRRQFVWCGTALFVLLCGIFTLWGSKATGALVATIIALPCLLAWMISVGFDKRIRTSIFIISIVVGIAALSTMNFWMEPLFEVVLESSGKDAGLTGRDILWRKADQLITERPWFGRGYYSFWVHNNLDAEYLWRAMGISTRTGFNFHNTPRDILVDLGFVGLALYAIVIFFAAAKLILRMMVTPNYSGILCCALFVFECPRVFFELIGFQNMHFATIIVFVVMAYGLRPTYFPAIGKA